MNSIFNKKTESPVQQSLISVLIIILISTLGYLSKELIDYRSVALVHLITVSLLAMFFDIFPVLLAAFLSAIIWGFVFIHPEFSFFPSSTEDSLMLLMYFMVASLKTVLTLKIRKVEEISRQKEEKANAIKLYNQILNSLSHELRSPITTIIGTTDNLINDNSIITNAERLELLTEISVASVKLNQQVENLLNMSRIEAGFIKPHFEWCNINMLIYDEINTFEEYHQQFVFVVEINEELPYVKLDYGLMKQVLKNLLQNAITYTPAKSTIKVKAEYKENELLLVVEDNGFGFPPDEIDHVFEKFYRLKNSKPGGTGLGLSIVKNFVEAQNGNITLSNLPYGGARFDIKIKTSSTTLISEL